MVTSQVHPLYIYIYIYRERERWELLRFTMTYNYLLNFDLELSLYNIRTIWLIFIIKFSALKRKEIIELYNKCFLFWINQETYKCTYSDISVDLKIFCLSLSVKTFVTINNLDSHLAQFYLTAYEDMWSWITFFWFLCFNGISTIVGYLMPKILVEEQEWYLTHSWGIGRFIPLLSILV